MVITPPPMVVTILGIAGLLICRIAVSVVAFCIWLVADPVICRVNLVMPGVLSERGALCVVLVCAIDVVSLRGVLTICLAIVFCAWACLVDILCIMLVPINRVGVVCAKDF